VQRIEADTRTVDKRPSWRRALANAQLPLYDVHWTPALLIEKPGAKRGDDWRIGLADGRILPLSLDNANARRMLKLYDVVLVHPVEGKGQTAARAELRVRPTVQGTVVVLENKTGRILAMAGGFSYPLSQLNRATQAVRQPGSAIKPLSYLAALGKGLQPNTLISDDSITLPPIRAGRVRGQEYWSPKNYDGGGGGTLTLRGLWKIRAILRRCICSREASKTVQRRASIGFASSRWKRRSTANACGTIRSCSAPNRYGRSISPLFTRLSPTRVCIPRRT
jgi:membrane carboxypeptidase/penicillin-binding protein